LDLDSKHTLSPFNTTGQLWIKKRTDRKAILGLLLFSVSIPKSTSNYREE